MQTERYYIIERKPLPPAQSFYTDVAEAAARLVDLRRSHPAPETLALIRVTEGESTVTQTEIEVEALDAPDLDSPPFTPPVRG